MLYFFFFLVSLNVDDQTKQKTSESVDNIEDQGDCLTTEGGDGLTTDGEGGSAAKDDGDITDKSSDDQQNVGEISDSRSEGEGHKHSRSTDEPDDDNAGSKRICLTPH